MSATPDQSLARIYPPNSVFNSTLLNVKFFSSCFAGAVAGILGLQNWAGFALFVVASLFTSLCIYTINCQGKPARFIPSGWSGLLNPGQENISTFILVWTLFFGIVHVYD
ncbi:ER membrane protein complex subunit 6 [Mycena chlorophos]|uniref:ER membrane protein complex subunit 6 n=1 Tax=Mycena chlorophos TaxID=658473 RepID=A0A8H6TDN2_MYCCL|nr:ER membrane protein complex subunit 6 [Mycena chlorophos]